GLAGGALGLAGLDRAEGALARVCADPGRVCTGNGQCCSGLCGPKDGTGRRHCACQTDTECVPPSNRCKPAVCADGACGIANADGRPCDGGSACTHNDPCQGGVCVGGVPVTCPAPTVCQASVACDRATGNCVATNKADDTPCGAETACARALCRGGQCVSVP